MEKYTNFSIPQKPARDMGLGDGAGNDNSALIPQHWAMESLATLEENMIATRLVHRDFEDQLQEYGDTVNTRRPRKFVTQRKTDVDCVEEQDAISDNCAVKLDQHIYSSFIIKDAEYSKSFLDLKNLYLKEAVYAVARGCDRAVIGQVHQFSNSVGRLNGLSSANAQVQITEADAALSCLNVPETDRRLILGPKSYQALLNTQLFTAVNESGSADALRRAQIGNLFGFDIFKGQNTPCVMSSNAEVIGTVDANVLAGSDAPFAVTLPTPAVAGEFFVVEGNDQPQVVSAATATDITPAGPSKYGAVSGSVIRVYSSTTAQAAYAQGYSMYISVAGMSLVDGQCVAFGTGANRQVYSVIETCNDGANQTILLDRPLESAVVAGQSVFPGPTGYFNLAFHRDAISFVNRPLASPSGNLGVAASTMSSDNMSIRVVMQYDSKCQGTRVTLDTLCGVKILDDRMGIQFLG